MEKGLNKLSIADTSHLLSNVLPDDSHEPLRREAWSSNTVNLSARQTTLIAYISLLKADRKTTTYGLAELSTKVATECDNVSARDRKYQCHGSAKLINALDIRALRHLDLIS